MSDPDLNRGWWGNGIMAHLERSQSLEMGAPFLLLEVWSQIAQFFGPWRGFEFWKILWPWPGYYIIEHTPSDNGDSQWRDTPWIRDGNDHFIIISMAWLQDTQYPVIAFIPHSGVLSLNIPSREMYRDHTTSGRICWFPSTKKKKNVTEAMLFSDKNMAFKSQPDTSECN